MEAIRILGTILRLEHSKYGQDSSQIEAVEASLVSWHLSLPPSKRGIVEFDGKVDEMLFQAHMIHYASVTPINTLILDGFG